MAATKNGNALLLAVGLCAAAVACSVTAAGCKQSPSDTKRTAASANTKIEPPKSSAQCAALPGAARYELRASADRKTLYSIVPSVVKGDKSAGEKRLSIAALDVASLTEKIAADKVSPDAAAAPGGRFVFTRREDKDKFGTTTVRRLYAVVPGQSEPVRLSPDEQDVASFVIDEAKSMVVFAAGEYLPDTIFKVSLTAPRAQAEKLGEGLAVVASLKGDDAALINTGGGQLARIALSGGATTPVAIERGRWILGVSQGYVLTKEKESPTPKVFATPVGPVSATPGGSPAVALPIAAGARDVMAREAADALYITAIEGEDSAVYKVEGAKVTKVLVARGVRITGVAGLDGGKLAVLATNDTDGDGEFGGDDEVDICFVDRAGGGEDPIAFPGRAAPLRLKETASKLAALTAEPELAGAKLRFETDSDGIDRLIVESAASGPADLSGLRARVRSVQARVTTLSGAASLSVSLRFAGNARRADSRWDADLKRFLSFGGVGTALAPEPSEYKLEVYPKVKTTVRIDADGARGSIGSAVCSGTVKNVGDQPIEAIDVTCSNKLRFADKPGEGTGKVAPAALAPGAEGTYSVKIEVADADGQFDTLFVSGGSRVPFFNRYLAERSARIAESAAKVFEGTGLAYVSHRTERGSREATRVVTVRAPASFAQLGADAQAARAGQASTDLGAAVADKEEKAIPIVLKVYELAGSRLVWTYEQGKLKEGAASGE